VAASGIIPTIRPEHPGDHGAIRRVVAAAFKSDGEADLVEAIRQSPEYVAENALIADIDGAIVGHVMISGAVLRSGTDREDRIVMLSPLAVDPLYHGQGIGSALVRAATGIANEIGEPFVILEGSPVYYSRFGFEHSTLYGIKIPLPDWAPSEAGQVLRLDNYDSNLRGTVVYPKAFDAL
jgi:putative acetyltransferase